MLLLDPDAGPREARARFILAWRGPIKLRLLGAFPADLRLATDSLGCFSLSGEAPLVLLARYGYDGDAPVLCVLRGASCDFGEAA